jgi:hypothetical protein
MTELMQFALRGDAKGVARLLADDKIDVSQVLAVFPFPVLFLTFSFMLCDTLVSLTRKAELPFTTLCTAATRPSWCRAPAGLEYSYTTTRR